MRHIDPALELNVGGDLLLHREVGASTQAARSSSIVGLLGPAEPAFFAGGAQEMQGRRLHVQAIRGGAQRAPAALVDRLFVLAAHDRGAPVHRLDFDVQADDRIIASLTSAIALR